ncbi:hypothetical protein C8F04DRAFT_1102941 [Mycena alexandri]|uniref:Uncharacterized protein n=1 Tax=Mycena alexandri TaxID=1745969 RepID=A0AAD6X404_9AGAR|nr:hypothetical protein C8F04DRAFT_1102941 [Mycena alexandri]
MRACLRVGAGVWLSVARGRCVGRCGTRPSSSFGASVLLCTTIREFTNSRIHCHHPGRAHRRPGLHLWRGRHFSSRVRVGQAWRAGRGLL